MSALPHHRPLAMTDMCGCGAPASEHSGLYGASVTGNGCLIWHDPETRPPLDLEDHFRGLLGDDAIELVQRYVHEGSQMPVLHIDLTGDPSDRLNLSTWKRHERYVSPLWVRVTAKARRGLVRVELTWDRDFTADDLDNDEIADRPTRTELAELGWRYEG